METNKTYLIDKIKETLNFRLNKLEPSSIKQWDTIDKLKNDFFLMNSEDISIASQRYQNQKLALTSSRTKTAISHNFNISSNPYHGYKISDASDYAINYNYNGKSKYTIRVKKNSQIQSSKKLKEYKLTESKSRLHSKDHASFNNSREREADNERRKLLIDRIAYIENDNHCLSETVSYKMKKQDKRDISREKQPNFITNILNSGVAVKDIYERVNGGLIHSNTIKSTKSKSKNRRNSNTSSHQSYKGLAYNSSHVTNKSIDGDKFKINNSKLLEDRDKLFTTLSSKLDKKISNNVKKESTNKPSKEAKEGKLNKSTFGSKETFDGFDKEKDKNKGISKESVNNSIVKIEASQNNTKHSKVVNSLQDRTISFNNNYIDSILTNNNTIEYTKELIVDSLIDDNVRVSIINERSENMNKASISEEKDKNSVDEIIKEAPKEDKEDKEEKEEKNIEINQNATVETMLNENIGITTNLDESNADRKSSHKLPDIIAIDSRLQNDIEPELIKPSESKDNNQEKDLNNQICNNVFSENNEINECIPQNQNQEKVSDLQTQINIESNNSTVINKESICLINDDIEKQDTLLTTEVIKEKAEEVNDERKEISSLEIKVNEVNQPLNNEEILKKDDEIVNKDHSSIEEFPIQAKEIQEEVKEKPDLNESKNAENQMNNELKEINEHYGIYLNSPQHAEIIQNKFKLNKISNNSLNFITKDSEIKLLDKDQPEEILNMFKLIYLFLNEDYSELHGNELIKNLFTNLYSKYHVDSLKTLFTLQIQENLSMSRRQIEHLITITDQNPKIFNTAELIKINRTMSYLSFVFKDIKEFILKKNEDGVFYEEIRWIKRRMQALNQELLMK